MGFYFVDFSFLPCNLSKDKRLEKIRSLSGVDIKLGKIVAEAIIKRLDAKALKLCVTSPRWEVGGSKIRPDFPAFVSFSKCPESKQRDI